MARTAKEATEEVVKKETTKKKMCNRHVELQIRRWKS